ncbi:MAG: hypothetical protein U9Q69_04145, partial [Nanoarchaeota archaeon]|nr:hypothetical protein [Nanoarchaeota archaeon]
YYTPYQGITHFEQQGLFLPSFALSCNILVALYANRSDADANANAVLMHYKDHGSGYGGWHTQNTVVKWNKGKGQVIHYPHDSDFPEHGGTNDVNQGKRQSLDFKVKGFGNMELKEALKKKHFKNYIKNLTGLPNPEILVEIGDYFSKPARVWVPSKVGEVETTRCSWLGCNNIDFILSTSNLISYNNAARGVLFGEPR